MNITIIGLGYVGIANAILWGSKHRVIGYDISKTKVDMLNNKQFITKRNLLHLLNFKQLNIQATSDLKFALQCAEMIIIAVSTDLNKKTKKLNTQNIEDILSNINVINKNAEVIIRSTVPINFTKTMEEKYPMINITYSPEFLRENSAFDDIIHPSRIIIGVNKKRPKLFLKTLNEIYDLHDNNLFFMSSSEAETVKLYSNSYLAMRVSFFNNLDSFCIDNNLNVKNVINAICSDQRIGNYYNNPSFGYGGYCLPKDTQQLLTQNKNSSLINAIIKSNNERKEKIIEEIFKKEFKTLGFYRLIGKKYSNNFRNSPVIDIINIILKKKKNIKIFYYEPLLNISILKKDVILIRDLEDFKKASELIVTNRITSEIQDVKDKIYTRDVFFID